MDRETGVTIRYIAKTVSIAAGIVLCFGLAGLFAWLIVREVVTRDHWWEIIPIIAVPVLVGPGGALGWLWYSTRRKIVTYNLVDEDSDDGEDTLDGAR